MVTDETIAAKLCSTHSAHVVDLHIANKVPRPAHDDNDEPLWLQQFGDDGLGVS